MVYNNAVVEIIDRRSEVNVLGKKSEKQPIVAIAFVGIESAARAVISRFEAKRARLIYLGKDGKLDFTAKVGYVIELANGRDFVTAAACGSGGIRLRITEASEECRERIERLCLDADGDFLKATAERAENGVTVTYAYYRDEAAEDFLMKLSRVAAKFGARTTCDVAYEPQRADETALNLVVPYITDVGKYSAPDFVFKEWLGAFESVGLTATVDVSQGIEKAVNIVKALLSKERIKWHSVKA